jgi:putative FmdB family regulatory protein
VSGWYIDILLTRTHMPLLEYRCSHCAQVFERLVPRTAGADTADCPSCGSNSAQRLLSLFAQVRGSDGASTASVAAGGCCGGGACNC